MGVLAVLENKMKQRLFGYFYRVFVRPILFLFEAERVHDYFISLGAWLGRCHLTRFLVKKFFYYEHPALRTRIGDLVLENPIGLAAGFDKNGIMLEIMPAVGFSFLEVGSVTANYCAGNEKPRIWRLVDQKALAVNYGLANDGVNVIAGRFARKAPTPFLTGASVAMTNCPENLDEGLAIADYCETFRKLEPVADFLTINISCPNARGGKTFLEPHALNRLLTAIEKIPTTKTVFVKMGPDLTAEKLDAVLDVLLGHRIHGLICSNLTKERDSHQGGLSGKLVFEKSNEQIARCYHRVKGQMFVVGCGGVSSAKDAYTKIRLGASAIQLITGMIFEGPQLIGQINRELVSLLQADGFSSVEEAVGVDNH